MLDSKDCC